MTQIQGFVLALTLQALVPAFIAVLDPKSWRIALIGWTIAVVSASFIWFILGGFR